VPALGALALLATLLAPIDGWAEPITGDPSAGRGAPSTGATISCGLEPDGTSTCAVAAGRASVCPARVPGEEIERSYRLYDYEPTEGGCTLPAEYWRTHSRNGGAPFDDTWDLLGDDAETKFFNAPQTPDQILAAGLGEGAYYRLARSYIAAQLNSSNGAPLPDAVAKAFEETTDLFLAADPAQLEPTSAARFEALADVLDDFNAGVAGPGSCGPPPESFSRADLGKVLEGLETRDAGTVVAVDERYGRGGVLTIRPQGEGDQFLTTDESFTLGGARKAEFTTVLADCVDVAAGQQTTVEVGGLPSAPQLASAAFLGRERLMRVLVAINDPAQAAEVVPAAGATATTPSSALAFRSGATTSGGGGGAGPAAFPSATLPSVGGTGGGGGGDFVLVPDVVGTTVVEATNILAGIGLRVGNVTTAQQLSVLGGFIGVAQAQENMIVVDQNPEAGELVSLDDPPAVDLEVEAPAAAIPEPGSLLLFATGLALIVIVMLRRRVR
jgi:hypothetical protein